MADRERGLNRREFLSAASALPMVALLPGGALAEPSASPPAATWRTFRISTAVEILRPAGTTRAWIPVPAMHAAWQRPGETTWTGNASSVRLTGDERDGAAMVAAEWNGEVRRPAVTVTSFVAVQEQPAVLARRGKHRLDRHEHDIFTAATSKVPTDGAVARKAAAVTRGATTDLAKARAIYDWVVENSRRDPATRGCGSGDVKAMFDQGSFSGKCADINTLYVALARSVGLPARDVYGIRVAPSRLGYRSLGSASPTVTRAQHCRAEVFLQEYGWVPVDPADVRKVVLEEQEHPTTLDDPAVRAARARLFGSWEMNWVAYNTAHDVRLPGSDGTPLPFLMYPQAETGAGRLDCLDPDNFRYAITATAA